MLTFLQTIPYLGQAFTLVGLAIKRRISKTNWMWDFPMHFSLSYQIRLRSKEDSTIVLLWVSIRVPSSKIIPRG